MRWIRVRVRLAAGGAPNGLAPAVPVATAEDLGDAAAAAFFLCGFTGVAVTDGEVTGYAPASPDGERAVTELGERLPGVLAALAPGAAFEVSRDEVEDTDWSEAWKRHWRPQPFGARLWVVPSWHAGFVPPEGARVLHLDPGTAFGTGDHASTHLALVLLEQALRRHAPAGAGQDRGPRVLDAGTGSGILALAAARLGAGSVLAVDVDGAAVDAARENLARNGLADRVAVRRADAGALAAELPPAAFDVIVANILAEVLIPMAPALARVLGPDGDVILSGVIAPARARVLDAYGAAGLVPRGTVRLGEWCGLWLGREGAAT